jgi:hypothetical protein
MAPGACLICLNSVRTTAWVRRHVPLRSLGFAREDGLVFLTPTSIIVAQHSLLLARAAIEAGRNGSCLRVARVRTR